MLRSAVVVLLTTLLVGCQASASEEATSPDAPQPPPLRVMVAGDSLSDGFYAFTRERGFASLVYADLATDRKVTPVTVAVPGARALGIAIEVLEQTGDGLAFDVVVLEAGANDVGESSMLAWSQTYRRLLAAVHASSPDATIVCLGPWGPPGASRPYEQVLRGLCEDQLYVRTSDLYATDGLRGPAGSATELGERDSFHPNDEGHAAIAERVVAALDGASATFG